MRSRTDAGEHLRTHVQLVELGDLHQRLAHKLLLVTTHPLIQARGQQLREAVFPRVLRSLELLGRGLLREPFVLQSLLRDHRQIAHEVPKLPLPKHHREHDPRVRQRRVVEPRHPELVVSASDEETES